MVSGELLVSVTPPVTFNWSYSTTLFNSTANVAPSKATSRVESVPGPAFPGATVDPGTRNTLVTLPVPASVAPDDTRVVVPVSTPVTVSVPAFTRVSPAYSLKPASVQLPPPFFVTAVVA